MYTKEEIITMYLNKFDFLNNAVGIETASRVYFGVEPAELNIEQAATLVGMCKNPSLYNPASARRRPKCQERRNVVLGQMLKAKHITQEECDSLRQLPIELDYHRVDHKLGIAPYFREYLRKTLQAKEPKRKNYASWQLKPYGQYYLDSLEWENNPLYGWIEKNPKADVLIFNIEEEGETTRRSNDKVKKIGLLSYMNYGAARLVIKRSAVSYGGVSFNLNFGGGTPHSCGEDTLFLRDCLKAGLKMYAVPYTVAKLTETRESSWFKGYTEKYFYDKGVVLGIAHPVLGRLFALYLTVRHGEYVSESEFSKKQILKFMLNGIKHKKGDI